MVKKAHRGRTWKGMGNEQVLRGLWEFFTLERAEVRKILAEASREKARRNTRSVATGIPFQRGFWNKSGKVRMQTVVPK